MGAYRVFFRESVRKDIEALPARDVQAIMDRIAVLSEDPRGPGCIKLSAQERYRVRQGNYRIIYSIQEKELTVWVVKVGHRRDVYR